MAGRWVFKLDLQKCFRSKELTSRSCFSIWYFKGLPNRSGLFCHLSRLHWALNMFLRENRGALWFVYIELVCMSVDEGKRNSLHICSALAIIDGELNFSLLSWSIASLIKADLIFRCSFRKTVETWDFFFKELVFSVGKRIFDDN